MAFVPRILEALGVVSFPKDEQTHFARVQFGELRPIRMIFQNDPLRSTITARSFWDVSKLPTYKQKDVELFVNLANKNLNLGALELFNDSLSLRMSVCYRISDPIRVIAPTLNAFLQTSRLFARPFELCISTPSCFFVSLVHDKFLSPIFSAEERAYEKLSDKPFDIDAIFRKNEKKFMRADEKNSKGEKKENDGDSKPISTEDPLKEVLNFIPKVKKAEVTKPRRVGEGGFAQIYLCEYLGTPVIVKCLKKTSTLSRDIRAMLAAELRVMAALRHPNIIQLIGTLESPFSIIMEYMTKGNLDTVITKESKTLKKHFRFSMLRDTARGMTYLHQQGIIHGDLKPLNLFVSDDYKVKVGDFGLAIIKGNGDEESSQIRGFTPAYAAPEYFRHISTRESDVFAFSSTIYFVMTGTNPFHGRNSKELKALIQMGKTPKLKSSLFPPPLMALTMKGWSISPKQRPQFSEFTTLFNQLASKK